MSDVSQFKDILIPPSASLLDAVRAIELGQWRTALVVDDARRLHGLINDADVRKALLRDTDLHSPVQSAMNPSPIVGQADWPRKQIMNLIRRKQCTLLPIVDCGNRLVGIETLSRALSLQERSNEVVLMAGGLGSRLAPYTQLCPKPLLKIGTKPVLETIVESFVERGFHNFWISVNYLAETIMDHFGDGRAWGVSIRYLQESEPLGTAGALSLLPSRPRLPLILMNGDILTKVNFADIIDFHNASGFAATMCLSEHEFVIPYGVVEAEEGLFKGIVEKPVQKALVNAGIYVIGPEIIDFMPKGTPIEAPALLKLAVARGMKVGVCPTNDYWIDIGTHDNLERAGSEFSSQFG